MQQFGFQQGAFVSSVAFDLLRLYPLNTTAATARLANLLRDGVRSSDIAAVKGSGCTLEYLTEVQGLWPISEIPPGVLLFPNSRKSKKPRTS